MPRLHTEAQPVVAPLLARTLWQALGLALLVVALPPLTLGQALLGPAASFWLTALPALALLTLHRRFLASAWRAHLVRATPRRRQRFATRGPRPVSRARRGAFARAA